MMAIDTTKQYKQITIVMPQKVTPNYFANLAQKATPVSTDEVLLIDNAASGVIKRATLAATLVDTGWVGPSSYGTNITADTYAVIQVRKIGKIAYVRGGIKASGGAVSAYSQVFTIPAAYAPATGDAHLSVRIPGSEAFRQIVISPGGSAATMYSLATNEILRFTGSWPID